MRNATFCFTFALGLFAGSWVDAADDSKTVHSQQVAARIDQLLSAEAASAGVTPAPLCSDEDFLRRVAFDLAGRPPKPQGIVRFSESSDPNKREFAIETYLTGDKWAANWATYWRDVIFTHATNQRARLAAGSFETWLADQLQASRGWNEIAADLITATGDVRENGATALIFAHDGDAAEIAGEVSRVFLGIQVQCANCHDHPYDQWKREDFHALAAFFPRVRVRQNPSTQPPTFTVVSFDRAARGGNVRERVQFAMRFLDINRDGRLTRQEADGSMLENPFPMLLQYGDKDGDGGLTLAEIAMLPEPMNQNNQTEYRMPDLNDPAAPGKLIQPRLFTDSETFVSLERDLDRRGALAESIAINPWFARAVVNRVWHELVGTGFWMPVDDLGPARSPRSPEVVELLCDEFISSGYDLRWLLGTIVRTEAYQRALATSRVDDGETVAFSVAQPRHLRADHVYAALLQSVGESTSTGFFGQFQASRIRFSPRDQFVTLFGSDPSTPPADVSGEIPQALFLMNSPAAQARLQSGGKSPINQIVKNSRSDEELIERLYLSTVARRPDSHEIELCENYLSEAPNRLDAVEDLHWSLMNSAEFVSRR